MPSALEQTQPLLSDGEDDGSEIASEDTQGDAGGSRPKLTRQVSEIRMVIEKKDMRSTGSYDYYQELANSRAVRPICITEGMDFQRMSRCQKLRWCGQTTIQMVSLLVFSVRSDRIFQPKYMQHHGKHYAGMVLITLLGWLPQVVDSIYPTVMGRESPVPRISLSSAIFPCMFGLAYYIIAITIYLECLAPYFRRKFGVARTVKIWEYYVSVAWQIQTIGFWVLTITPPLFQEEFKAIPTWVTTWLGLFLVLAGLGSKAGAVYGTGYNTYYWYDMVTNIPNAYFVQVGIYKCCGSPTYTLGRFTGFGAAIHYRSVPMAIAAIVELMLISLFNQYVEQPFVKKMYLSRRPSV